jgi:hypothetical protein
MRWSVRLNGDLTTLRELQVSFNSGHIRIKEEDKLFYLESDVFEGLSDRFDVYKHADEIAKWLNG